jgi:hypothetical protein
MKREDLERELKVAMGYTEETLLCLDCNYYCTSRTYQDGSYDSLCNYARVIKLKIGVSGRCKHWCPKEEKEGTKQNTTTQGQNSE